MEKKNKITKKQKDFVRAYLKNGHNATAAAREAGYSSKTARQIAAENLSKPYIAQFLDEESKKNEEEFRYTLVDHIKDLDYIAAEAIAREDFKTALAAKTNKGKCCGLYIEKHSVDGDIKILTFWGGDEDR